MKKYISIVSIITFLILVSSCAVEEPSALEPNSKQEVNSLSKSIDYSKHKVVLGYAEYLTDPASGEAARTEYFRKDLGNGQLGHDFVYGDPRRALFNGGVPGISYGVKYENVSSDVNLENQGSWMTESILIWDAENCADLTLSENVISSASPGVVENFFSGGGINLSLLEADLTQVGFRGVSTIFPPGTSTLGVTYTLFWVDANGNLTDIDGNKKADVAFREIYYNDQYEWADNGIEGGQPDGSRIFDFPTVAIHEVGHGLSAAHFGNIGSKNGFLVAKPRTVMNAIYGGVLRELTGRDRASLCSNWAQWPNK